MVAAYKDGKPRRAIVASSRAKTDGRMVVVNKLECGHSLRFTGEKAYEAKYAKHRYCRECALPASQREEDEAETVARALTSESLAKRTDRLISFQHAFAIAFAIGWSDVSTTLSGLKGNYALARLYWKEIERRAIERSDVWQP
jgi:hypothetical protein